MGANVYAVAVPLVNTGIQTGAGLFRGSSWGVRLGRRGGGTGIAEGTESVTHGHASATIMHCLSHEQFEVVGASYNVTQIFYCIS